MDRDGGAAASPARGPRRTRLIGAPGRIALAWGASLSLLAWLTRGVEWDRLGEALRPAPWWVWTAAAAGIAASYGFRALRIHAELRRSHSVTISQCLRVMLLHNTAVN